MIKIENGMYVRHKCGNGGQTISRCTNKVNIAYNVFYIHTDVKGEVIYKSNILKASHNIIDLIEVGDYVNGLKITLINEPSMANCNKRIIYAEDEEGYLIKYFDENDIKSIVTKEQFESMEYKVGGKNE